VSWLEAELQEQPAALARLIDKQAHPAGLNNVTLTR
jgi:hypothetical protein